MTTTELLQQEQGTEAQLSVAVPPIPAAEPWIEYPRPPTDAVSYPNLKFARCLTDAIVYTCLSGWPETFRKISWKERCAGLARHQWEEKWFRDWASYTPGKFPANGAARFQPYTACGKFAVASTSAAVRYGTLHNVHIAHVLSQDNDSIHLQSCTPFSEPAYPGTDTPTSVIDATPESIVANMDALDREFKAGAERIHSLRIAYDAAVKQKEVDWSQLPAKEIRGLKTRKHREKVEAENEDAEDSEIVESDSEIFESETDDGTCYNNDPRFDDDEEFSGKPEGHDHIIPMYEDGTRETEEPKTHEQLAAIRQTAKDKIEAGEDAQEVGYKLEMFTRNRTAQEVAEKLYVSPATVQKWKERFFVEAMSIMDGKKEIPYTGLTYKQAADVMDNDGVYALVKLPNSDWKWFKLDVSKHGTVEAALDALKVDKMFNALEDNKAYMRDVPGTMGPIKARYDWSFRPDRVRIIKRPEPAWMGLLAKEE